MSSIDDRIVNLQFNNGDFERKIQSTLDGLSQLNKGLKLEGASKGLSDVSAAANKFSLQHISDAVDGIANKFSTMSLIGISALNNLVGKAIDAGTRLVKSISTDPITQGLHEYETQLNSVQTILANTGLEGQKGLDKVNAALGALNTYSDKTIYNFSEMARNIGTFTAAGVDLDTSVNAIKGIANLAAISGSSSEQASTAMYQLSQALASGTVKLMDWNSVVNAGMGGKVFQEALKETARAHGIAIDDIIKKEGSFRESLKNGWLSSGILTETLNKFTGDMTTQQLKQLGYTDKQIVAIQKMGKTAQDAATKVKTMSQLISTLQEAAGSGWAQTWQILFGDFEEARTLFTDVSNVLGGFISASAAARNNVLKDWKELGGRTALIQTISNVFHGLLSVLKPIKDAFRSIFPATTGKQLYEFTLLLRDASEYLKIGGDTADKVKRTFAGFFAIFDIGKQVLLGIINALARVFGAFDGAGGGILNITANLGDFLVAIDNAIKKGTGFQKFFDNLGQAIAVPVKLIARLVSAIGSLFTGLGDVSLGNLSGLPDIFAPLGVLGDRIYSIWSNIIGVFKTVYRVFEPLASKFSDFFSALGEKIQEGLNNIDYNSVLDSINTGLLAGIALLFKKFLSNGVNVDLGGGVLSSIKESFEGLTGVMSAMQTQLKAGALMKIAAAIGILTVSVVALSLIDSKKLTIALGAITAMFTQLAVSMAAFGKIFASQGFIKMPVVTASLILLAIAIDLLAVAVAKLAGLDWNGLVKGLAGVGVLLAEVSVATRIMNTNAKGMISTGAGLLVLAAAIRVLVGAVTDLSGLSWEEMAKGLVGVGVLLGALALFTKFAEMDGGGVLAGTGLVLLAAGIKILASAMADISKLSWEQIAKGLVGIAGGLTLLGLALNLIPPSSVFSAAAVLIVASSLGMISDAIASMGSLDWGTIGRGLTAMAGALTAIGVALALLPPTTLLSAAAIFVVASSLGMIADALGQMGAMTWEQIAKGLITLAGALAIIAGALYLMTGTLAGAAAIVVVSAALTLLAPALLAFGNMSLAEIGKSLLMMAGVFVVLGVSGLVLTPLVPVLLALGVAVVLLGVGMLAAGAGVLAFSLGLTALSAAGAAGAAAIVAIVSSLVGLIPMVMRQIGLGIQAFAETIALASSSITKAMSTVIGAIIDAISVNAPKIIALMVKLLTGMLNAVVTMAPRIASAMLTLLNVLLATIQAAVPRLVQAGFNILVSFLNGIANNISRVVTAATNIIVNFLNGISQNLPRIIDAGVKTIVSFVNGLAQAIRSNSGAMRDAGKNLAFAIADGMSFGLASKAGGLASKAASVAKGALGAAKSALGINSPSKEFFKLGAWSGEGMVNGLDSYSGAIQDTAKGVGKDAILAMSKTISGMSKLVNAQMDIHSPTITPVLDLSSVKKDASQIGSLLNSKPLEVTSAYSTAQNASAGYQANQAAAAYSADSQPQEVIQFNQNNYSPKALSSAEIYRQTNNQLSKAKGALTP